MCLNKLQGVTPHLWMSLRPAPVYWSLGSEVLNRWYLLTRGILEIYGVFSESRGKGSNWEAGVGSEISGRHSAQLGTAFSSVQFSHSVMSDSLQPHRLQHVRPPCPSPTPRVYSNSYPLSRWCHPTISSSVIPFVSCLQSFPASQSFLMSQFFTAGSQSIRISASTSVLSVNIQDWFPLGWTGWISLQSKELSRVFSNTTVQKHQFFGTQLSL